jgi:hypothetical protein
MKRRKFIQSSLVASAATAVPGAVVAAEGQRVFGTPTSLTGGTEAGATKMLLPLSRSGMPASGWAHWSKLSAAAVDMFTDEVKRAQFNQNPKAYLASIGFDTSQATLDASSLSLLVALSHPAVNEAVEARNYDQLLEYLQVSGALKRPSEDVLVDQLTTSLNSNLEMIRASLGMVEDDPLYAEKVLRFVGATDRAPSTADLAAIGNIAELIRVAPGQLVVGAAILVVAAIDAVVGVTVAVVVFTIAAVVNAVSVKTVGTTDPNRVAQGPFNGQLSRLDPDICDSCDVAQRASAMLGTPGLFSAHEKLVIKNEVRAFLRALERVGLVRYEGDAFDTVAEAVYTYGMRTISEK